MLSDFRKVRLRHGSENQKSNTKAPTNKSCKRWYNHGVGQLMIILFCLLKLCISIQLFSECLLYVDRHRIFRILKFTTDMYLTCLVFIQDILCHLRKHLTFAKPLQIVSIKEVPVCIKMCIVLVFSPSQVFIVFTLNRIFVRLELIVASLTVISVCLDNQLLFVTGPYRANNSWFNIGDHFTVLCNSSGILVGTTVSSELEKISNEVIHLQSDADHPDQLRWSMIYA